MNCPLCKSAGKIILSRKDMIGSVHMSSTERRTLEMIYCPECCFVWNKNAFEKPDEFNQWMNQAYQSYNLLNNNLHKFPLIDVRTVRAKQFIEKKISFDSITTVLEIGSNRGDFLAYLNDSHPHIQVIGVETTKLAMVGVPTIFNDVMDINLSPSFDLIILRQVFEHIADPFTFLQHLKSFLKKGGFIMIEVPDLENDLDDNIDPWVMEHVAFYSVKSLKYISEITNLKIRAIDRENQLMFILQDSDEDRTIDIDIKNNINEHILLFEEKINSTSAEWLKLINDGYHICFYGASNVFLTISGVLANSWKDRWHSIDRYLCDDYDDKFGREINGITVTKLNQLNTENKYIFVISAMYREHRKNMLINLKNQLKQNDIVYEMWDKIIDVESYLNNLINLTKIVKDHN